MKKMILPVLCLMLAAGTQAAPAAKAPKKPSEFSALHTWFTHLRAALTQEMVADYYQKGNITAVAAVRGAKQASVNPDRPVWKGGWKDRRAIELKKEKAEFARSVDLILDGKIAQGRAGLAVFQKAHPKSSLSSDVKLALAKSEALEAASEKTAGSGRAGGSKASPAKNPQAGSSSAKP